MGPGTRDSAWRDLQNVTIKSKFMAIIEMNKRNNKNNKIAHHSLRNKLHIDLKKNPKLRSQKISNPKKIINKGRFTNQSN
jgi:hypothetical protein